MPLVTLTAGIDQEAKNWEKLDLKRMAKRQWCWGFCWYFKGILKGLQQNME